MKWICKVCGYVYEGNEPPEFCPVCKVGKDKFERLEETPQWTDVHTLGLAQGMDERVVAGLRKQYEKECIEAGAYMAMARQADGQGYPEIANSFQRMAMEEVGHAARLAEILGEQLVDDVEKNVKNRVEIELNACKEKQALALLAKELGYDAVHDTVHEMCKDEARHGKGYAGLLKRYFGK